MAGYLQENEGVIRKPVTINTLQDMKNRGEKIAALTCYDASFSSLMDREGVEVMLIGDSLGMTFQGQSTTLPVTIEDIEYHTCCVAKGNSTAFILCDMPFGTYATPVDAYDNAAILMKAGAHMVKLEGGAWLSETVHFLTERAIPVCAHIGLTPQSIHQFGGFKVQGKTEYAAEKLKADALALQNAGAALLVLEAIPASLGKEVTELLSIPTIGIGAGVDCSGQILVMQDLLGIYPKKPPRFAKNFMAGSDSIQAAVSAYIKAVKEKTFPASEHCF